MCVICLYYISYVYASEEWKYKLMEFIGAECDCHAFNFFFLWDGKIFEIEKRHKGLYNCHHAGICFSNSCFEQKFQVFCILDPMGNAFYFQSLTISH
jgi:hypothetical protein